MLEVLNTLTGRREPLAPIEPGKLKMYVCGPTVYDHSHIGHGRVYVLYDAIVRYLRWSGYDVTYVRNITDIDDKIIRKATEAQEPYGNVAARFTSSFHEDMSALGLLAPDVEPRASETIEEIQALIQTLIEKGHAYASSGDVYFSVTSLKEYGKLSKRDLENLKSGARVEPGEQKREPLDFALWKAMKPGEPAWPSPWGLGRPGWHIECSAMARKFLGKTIDIHAGGHDLIFPHHENEIAQSEAANGVPFAHVWLHNGFVNIHKEKMSKSLGNIVTLKALLAKFHSEALKLYLLASHYRSPIEFSDSGVEEAARGLDRMYRVLLAIPAGHKVEVGVLTHRFREAMNDDFNTAKAVAALFDGVKEANRLQQKKETVNAASALRSEIVELARVLGILNDDPAHYFQSLPGIAGADRAKIEQLLAQRAEARRTKDFSRADSIREQLKSLNVLVEDAPDGTTWRLEG